MSQHRLVVFDIRSKEEPKRKVRKIRMFRTWKVKNVETKYEFSKAVEKLNTGWEKEGDAEVCGFSHIFATKLSFKVPAPATPNKDDREPRTGRDVTSGIVYCLRQFISMFHCIAIQTR